MMGAYHRPASLEEAAHLAARANTTILAGGTDVYPARTARAGWGQRQPTDIVDITRLTDLRGIEDRGDHWWIGALTTWSDIAAAEQLPPLFDGLKAAAREIGGLQIQNRGTLGGNLCTASPAGDSIPCLLSLDAVIACAGAAQARTVPVADFFTAYRQTILGRDLVTGVRVPKQSGRGCFVKLGARRYLVISIAMVAAAIDLDADLCVRSARLAVGACSATARRLPRLEQRLLGTRLGHVAVEAQDLADLTPIDDIRASAGYRRAAARQLVQDLLDRARREAA